MPENGCLGYHLLLLPVSGAARCRDVKSSQAIEDSVSQRPMRIWPCKRELVAELEEQPARSLR